jgi:hypothetical protein
MKPKKYSPKRITGSYQPKGGDVIQFLGYMDGTFVELEYNEDAVTLHNGGQGDATFVLNANMSAKLVVTFVQGSETNDALSKYVPDARRNYMPTGMLSLRDLDGNTIASDESAVIAKMAKVTFGKEVSGREWTFIMPSADITAGGDNS